jgi:hypothetical protein
VSEDKPKRRLPIRWLTLAEIVGVAALVIAGLGYWDGHRQRTQEELDRAAAGREHQAEVRASEQRRAFLMTGSAQGSGDLIRITPKIAEQVIQTQTLYFPSAVRAEPVQTTGNPRIERGWFEDGLRKAERDRKHEQKAGDTGRLPVGVVTTYEDDGQIRSDRAIYLIGYSLHDRMLRGAQVQLDGLSLARRGVSGDLQAAVDAMWPAPKG